MKHLPFLVILFFFGNAQSQTSAPSFNFIEYQRSFPRFSDALKRREDTLMKQFREKNLDWPAKNIYLRSFKFDSQLEVWVQTGNSSQFRLFKTYKVCALAGSLGPKRMAGDYQVPEGFYCINEFNPKSAYYLSLGINYPNSSDRILADSLQPGGDIYIHGKCVTTGCIPITDQQIEDVYILAAQAHAQGQDFIPVHIFPIQYKNPKSIAYLVKYLKEFPEYVRLSNELKHAYMYFEKNKKLPLVLTDKNGDYIVENYVQEPEPEPVIKKKERRAVKNFNEELLAKVVDRLPVFPGGNEGFQLFIDTVSREMSQYLEDNQRKTYVMIEFIIDRDGNPAYAKVIKGGNDELNDKLQERFENMPAWKPATRLDNTVAIKLKQSLEVEKK
jgi:murein L,D-transpeptidase YafK